MTNQRKIELLAPAKDSATAIEAINCGADAIYMGASKFGARSSAGNSIDDIKKVVEYAHLFNVKVYVTLNTIIKNEEIDDVEKLIADLYRINVDALIVQDMGILEMNILPIQLHASTQCDIRTIEKSVFLEKCGFSQIVLARELTLEEISAIHKNISVPLEIFVHGALCVSYSGKCHVSEVLKGRSANRGECAQLCRLPYDLVDGDGNILKEKKHLLSLRDLNQITELNNLLEAGASSFKIEGRLKDISYVRNVVAKYRKAIDDIIINNTDRYIKSSSGLIEPGFIPKLEKSFNRSFTNYFLKTRQPQDTKMASFNTPKSFGEEIGHVVACNGREILVKSKYPLNNGDGLSYLNENDEYDGFRVNKIIGNKIETLTPIFISPNTKLYRTYDKSFEDTLKGARSKRFLRLDIELVNECGNVFIIGKDELGNESKLKINAEIGEAQKSQHENQLKILSKLGDTHYYIGKVKTLDKIFIPASLLTQLRRDLIIDLTNKQLDNYITEKRKMRDPNFTYPEKKLTFAENVSNHLSEKFYKEHGVENIEYALEVSKTKDKMEDRALMTTRYCLLRELGCCKKNTNSIRIKEPLLLKNNDVNLRLEFDCNKCEMKIKRNHR